MKSRIQNPVKIYLGGNHRDTGDWRKDFNQQAAALITASSRGLCGVDPFDRNIDENDNQAIIRHDLALLTDEDLGFLVLKSLDHMGNLSTGTACEMMIAHNLGKPVIVLIEATPEGGQKWKHPFVEHFASHVTDSIPDALRWIVGHQ